MIRQSREEQKIRAGLLAQFRYKQKLEFIDFKMDVLEKTVNDFLDRATLPEPPSDLGIEITLSSDNQKKPRATHTRKKA